MGGRSGHANAAGWHSTREQEPKFLAHGLSPTRATGEPPPTQKKTPVHLPYCNPGGATVRACLRLLLDGRPSGAAKNLYLSSSRSQGFPPWHQPAQRGILTPL